MQRKNAAWDQLRFAISMVNGEIEVATSTQSEADPTKMAADRVVHENRAGGQAFRSFRDFFARRNCVGRSDPLSVGHRNSGAPEPIPAIGQNEKESVQDR